MSRYMHFNDLINDISDNLYKGAVPSMGLILFGFSLRFLPMLEFMDVSLPLIHWAQLIAFILGSVVSLITIYSFIRRQFKK